jgi:hypothetical protein
VTVQEHDHRSIGRPEVANVEDELAASQLLHRNIIRQFNPLVEQFLLA